MTQTKPPNDDDFEEMLAGLDRVIHDKDLQQQLLNAGLLVRTEPVPDTRTTENPEPRTEAGRRLVRLYAESSLPIRPEEIAEVEAEAAQGVAPHPRTYSLVGGGLDMFLVTDDESGQNIGYARKIGGPITAPIQGAAPLPPCPICGKPDLFIGTDGKPGCPHCEVAVRLPSEGAAPRAEGEEEWFGDAPLHGHQENGDWYECTDTHAGAAPRAEGLDGDTLRDLTEIVGKALYGWGDDEPNAATGHIALTEVASIAAAVYEAGFRRLAPQERRD